MHEVWKEQQVDEDARKVSRAEVFVRKVGKMGETDTWRLKDKKRRITRKKYQRLLNEFEMKVSWRKKDCGISRKNKALHDRGAPPKDEGDAIRECTKRTT